MKTPFTLAKIGQWLLLAGFLCLLVFDTTAQEKLTITLTNPLSQEADIFIEQPTPITLEITNMPASLTKLELIFNTALNGGNGEGLTAEISQQLSEIMQVDSSKSSFPRRINSKFTFFVQAKDSATEIPKELSLTCTVFATEKESDAKSLEVWASYQNGSRPRSGSTNFTVKDPPSMLKVPLVFSCVQSSVLLDAESASTLTLYGYLPGTFNDLAVSEETKLLVKIPKRTEQTDSVANKTPATLGNKSQTGAIMRKDVSTSDNLTWGSDPSQDATENWGFSTLDLRFKPGTLSRTTMLKVEIRNLKVSGTEGPVKLYIIVEDMQGFARTEYEISVLKSNIVEKDGKVGIGTNSPQSKLHVKGPILVDNATDTLGDLRFTNGIKNKKIVLWASVPNKNQFYGFGINSYTLRYQVNDPAARHVFYAAKSATESTELMRIQGNGMVGIGVQNPKATLHVKGYTRLEGSFVATGTTTLESLQVSERIQDKTGDVMPVGAIMAYGGVEAEAPKGWKYCEGQLLNIAEYPDLFAKLGTTYGGDGRVNFGLPDLQSRFIVGAGSGTIKDNRGNLLTTYKNGDNDGVEFFTLTNDHMPSHSHSGTTNTDEGLHSHTGQRNHRADNDSNDEWGNYVGVNGHNNGNYRKNEATVDISSSGSEHTHSFTTDNSGRSQPHENRPPFFALKYIIKY